MFIFLNKHGQIHSKMCILENCLFFCIKKDQLCLFLEGILLTVIRTHINYLYICILSIVVYFECVDFFAFVAGIDVAAVNALLLITF